MAPWVKRKISYGATSVVTDRQTDKVTTITRHNPHARVTNINNCGVLTSTVVVILVGESCKKKQKKTADQSEGTHHLVILAHACLNAFLDSDTIHYACDLLLHPILLRICECNMTNPNSCTLLSNDVIKLLWKKTPKNKCNRYVCEFITHIDGWHMAYGCVHL